MTSLRNAPLLVGDLPRAPALDRAVLGHAQPGFSLNFKQKLGHLYEDAMGHLLAQSDVGALLASNLQVMNDEGRTLGELDFVLCDGSSGRAYHLELAVKFYLAHRGADGWLFPGPDPRDNWQRKLERMQTHQLRLAEDPYCKRILKDRFDTTEISVRQLIYGRLFHHMEAAEHPLPEAMRADGLRGRWLYRKEWSRWMASASEIRIIPKALWPVELSQELVQHLPLVEDTELHRQAAERCTLFVADDCLKPIFLVPDAWPDGAS